MQDGLFFRIVRRINLLLVLLLSLVLIVAAGLVGWRSYERGEWASLVPDRLESQPSPPKPTVKYEVALAPYEAPAKDNRPTANGIFVLNRVSSLGDMDLGAPDVANIMEVDVENHGFWLFKGANRTITMRDGVRKGELPDGAPTDSRPVIALVLWVVEKDANKDGEYGAGDPISVYVWRIGEEKVTKLLDAEEGLSTGQISGTKYGVVYQKSGKNIAATYSIPDFKLISERVLPDPMK